MSITTKVKWQYLAKEGMPSKELANPGGIPRQFLV